MDTQSAPHPKWFCPRQSRQPLFRPRNIVLTLLLVLAVLLPSCVMADPSPHIFIYENGVAVDETSLYSYSESHLISMSTGEIVGYSALSNPTTLYDANGQVIGYLDYSSP
jgi:hypothetical protein